MTPAPDYTIAIPAYRERGMLERAIRSALAQTLPVAEVLVSVDGTDAATLRTARRLADHDHVRVLEHGERLGWERNHNALLDEIRTPAFLFLAQDDWLDPACAERLARAGGDAVCVYPTVRLVGDKDGIRTPGPYTGPATSRLARLLTGSVHAGSVPSRYEARDPSVHQEGWRRHTVRTLDVVRRTEPSGTDATRLVVAALLRYLLHAVDLDWADRDGPARLGAAELAAAVLRGDGPALGAVAEVARRAAPLGPVLARRGVEVLVLVADRARQHGDEGAALWSLDRAQELLGRDQDGSAHPLAASVHRRRALAHVSRGDVGPAAQAALAALRAVRHVDGGPRGLARRLARRP